MKDLEKQKKNVEGEYNPPIPDCELEQLARMWDAEPNDCYTPNDSLYPLCKGNKNALYECSKCCVYENMDEEYIVD